MIHIINHVYSGCSPLILAVFVLKISFLPESGKVKLSKVVAEHSIWDSHNVSNRVQSMASDEI